MRVNFIIDGELFGKERFRFNLVIKRIYIL